MSTAKKAPVGQATKPAQTSQAFAAGPSIAYSADHLANQFLIAMPGMVDPNFAGSVIYLFEHTERGAMGLVINRPTELDMGALFEKIEVKLEAEPVSDQPVYFGGPVQIERGFVLHEPTKEVAYSSSLAVPGGLTMTTSKDVLEAVATGSGPSKFLMTLGYAGWSAGQLEEEITLNGWINVPLSQQQMIEIIFDTPSSQRYERTMGLLGFDPSHLSGEAGHA
jgi:putative transcriptional regulator